MVQLTTIQHLLLNKWRVIICTNICIVYRHIYASLNLNALKFVWKKLFWCSRIYDNQGVINNMASIGSDNGLAPSRCQAII